MTMIADLHCHTIQSSDSCNHFRWIINRCQKVGINCLAVTDHNSIDGAIRLKEIAPFYVIIGEEVDTGEGEIIGLFLHEYIPPKLGLKKTIEAIKKQDGLVYLPHPLSISRKSALNVNAIIELYDQIDIVEVFNSRTRRESLDKSWFYDWISKGSVVKAVGSDAHAPHEFGNVLIFMEDFSTKEEFLNSLKGAQFRTRKTSLLLRVFVNHNLRKAIRYLSQKK